MQLELFDNLLSADKTLVDPAGSVISWSYSKMGAFRDCPRKFYYSYYGSKRKNAKAEPLKEELIKLSKLSNRYMVQGSIIHQLISTYFKHAKKDELWNLNRLMSFALSNLNETISFNNFSKSGIDTATKYPKPLVKELLNGTITSQQFLEIAMATIKSCLQNFFESEQYAGLRFGGMRPSAIIEGNASFSLSGQVEVDGKIDIAFLDEQKLIITDWKTGKKEMEDTSLQLLVYALWARQFDEWSFETVEIKKAYLMTGALEDLEFSTLHIERARVKILQDAEMLSEMDEFGRNAVREAFTKHVGQNCLLCPYEQICKSH